SHLSLRRSSLSFRYDDPLRGLPSFPTRRSSDLRELASRPASQWVVDVGTGSGAIAIAIKKERPDLEVLALDISAKALDVARANAARHGVAIQFAEGDLLAPAHGRPLFAAIVSNPPYVRSEEIAHLPKEVRAEPWTALDGGHDG